MPPIQIIHADVDHADRRDDQPGVGLDDVEVALGVAIEVNVPEQVRRLRLDRDLMGQAALPRQIARAEMEQP